MSEEKKVTVVGNASGAGPRRIMMPSATPRPVAVEAEPAAKRTRVNRKAIASEAGVQSRLADVARVASEMGLAVSPKAGTAYTREELLEQVVAERKRQLEVTTEPPVAAVASALVAEVAVKSTVAPKSRTSSVRPHRSSRKPALRLIRGGKEVA